MLTTLSPLAFALLAWGSVALVLGVFAYEVYELLGEWRLRR
ncbi:hypothetical protein [Halomarina ordinaria]|uniref:Uncharacterized protein n=1 Tax=Halomarina ordinaria TaxID=3033939 RepID=A0ABD5U5P4_9EURY|nr:hypothetical protein [Halomarina sp. PSRA2]